MAQRFMRLPKVKEDTGRSTSTIYLKMSRDEFPKAFNLGGRAVAWLESDIQAWIEDRVRLSRLSNAA